MRKNTRRHPNIQSPPGFEFTIPKGHLKVVISVTQERGAIDKDEALKILKTRPHIAGVLETMQYRGTTSKYHVFSYPDPAGV